MVEIVMNVSFFKLVFVFEKVSVFPLTFGCALTFTLSAVPCKLNLCHSPPFQK